MLLFKNYTTVTTHKIVIYESDSLFAEKFVQLNNDNPKEQPIKILRIYGRMVENNDFSTFREHLTEKVSNYKSPDWGKPFILHHIIRDKKSTNVSIKDFIELEDKMKAIRESEIPSAQFYIEFQKAKKAAEDAVLKKGYDIVLCTCNEVSGSRLRRVGTLKHCIIDEAGMASEPESLMPMYNCEHVVLIGDHAQLQPVIQHKPASEHGLSISLFQRYAAYYKDYMYTLKIQYRMVSGSITLAVGSISTLMASELA